MAATRPSLCAVTTGDATTRPDGSPLTSDTRGEGTLIETFTAATKLGLTSFGGPIAHLGYFREEYVARRRWLNDREFADLVALCQFLPGPASSQVGIAIGMLRAGWLGGIASWVGFTLPSAILMVLFAFFVREADLSDAGWLHGLKVLAVAVVANAVWGMARTLAPDRPRGTIALLAAIAVLASQTAAMQIAVIALAGLVGRRSHQRLALGAGALFFVLLLALPLASAATGTEALAVFDSFYRTGALVFGGGHVVLPLLQAEVVPPGWISQDAFVAGYGAAQAVPGPLFAFAAYLGALLEAEPNGVVGAAFALLAIYLPSFLLVAAVLPFWDTLRTREPVQRALHGINAAVVGILLATLYTPVSTSAIVAAEDLALALGIFGLIVLWRAPLWLVVVVAAVAGEVLSR